jgi:integrase
MPKFIEGFADRMQVPAGMREIQVFDDDLPGFGIRKFASGKASYFVKFNIGPQQRRLTLGRVIRGNLKEMRLEASRVLAKARLGTDVAAVKRAAADRLTATFSELVARYLDDRQPKLRPRYHVEIKRQLERDWKSLHGMQVETVTRQNVVGVVDNIAAGQGQVAADRARTALSGFYGWAIERGYCEANPTLNIAPRAEKRSRNRVLTEAELVEVWRVSGDDDYGRIVRLLILTGQRKSEIADLARSEIDFERGLIELPPERTKNRRPHLVPLSNEVLSLLPNGSDGRDLVFGRGAGGFSGWSKAKAELDERIAAARNNAGITKAMQPWRVHDLRRSFVTHMNERGIAPPHIVEAIVNHVSGHLAGVAGIYNKALYLAERRQALQHWGEHVIALVMGKNLNVVPIKGAR